MKLESLYYRNDTKKLVTIGGIVYRASKNKLIRRNSLLKRMCILYFILLVLHIHIIYNL